MAEQVERGPLGGEQGPRRAGGSRDLRGDLVPPLGLGGDLIEPTGPRLPENLPSDVDPEQHAGRLLRDRGAPGRVLGDHRLGGDVAGPEVLEQGPGDQLARVAVDFHRSHNLTKAWCATFYGQMSNETLPPFQALLDEHGTDVLGFLVASVGPHDAEDCFQETFIAALRAYPKLEHASNLRSWLLTIAHRKAIDHHRARGRRAVPAGSPEEVAGDTPSSNNRPDTTVGRGDPELWRAVSGLPPKQRSAVVLRFATDMSYAGIAKALDCSQDAARRSVHEGLQKLRGEFA